jgi:hypothetical protein
MPSVTRISTELMGLGMSAFLANYLAGYLAGGGASGALTGTFTLTPNASSTVVPLTGCKPSSTMPCPCPLTAHAANDVPFTSYTMQTDQFTVSHPNNPNADSKFMFALYP